MSEHMDVKLHKDSILAMLSANKLILDLYGVNRIGLKTVVYVAVAD
jgi:hypothetical protein